MSYRQSRRSSGLKLKKILLIGVVFSVLSAAVAVTGSYFWYKDALQPVNNDTSLEVVTIQPGASAESIATTLAQRQIIRSSRAFMWYLRVEGLRASLQAGAYELSPSMSVAEITGAMVAGDVATELFTILPAQRLDQIRSASIAAGYSATEVDAALQIENYKSTPLLTRVPEASSLEGLLYPESYQRTADTSLQEIFTQALALTEATLDPVRVQVFATYGMTPYEALVLASIVEREVSNAEDRPIVAQVFLKRLQEGIALGSDPTALFGALNAGIEPSVFADTPYNTRLYAGLPPGPINNVSEASMEALTNPSNTEYLYFVSGDDGTTHFSYTLEEHESLTAQYCIELCQSY